MILFVPQERLRRVESFAFHTAMEACLPRHGGPRLNDTSDPENFK